MNAPARHIVLLYDDDALTGDTAAQDVVAQLDALESVFRAENLDVFRLPVNLDLSSLQRRIQALRPDCVFNLVESLGGADRLQTIVPLLLEEWRIPFTGCGSLAMQLSNHKIAAKERLIRAGLPTPDCAWLEHDRLALLPKNAVVGDDWILKTRESHASEFINDDSVVKNANAAVLAERLRQAERAHGQPFFAEQFIDGREFNLSLLAGADGQVSVLPPAEISFANLPHGKPRLVGYDAKWNEESAEYVGTPRIFPGDADAALLQKLRELALAVWHELGLAGYARVDFRVDTDGNPFVLEANSNPCLSPDAGFAAAAERGGLSFSEMAMRIIEAAVTAR